MKSINKVIYIVEAKKTKHIYHCATLYHLIFISQFTEVLKRLIKSINKIVFVSTKIEMTKFV